MTDRTDRTGALVAAAIRDAKGNRRRAANRLRRQAAADEQTAAAAGDVRRQRDLLLLANRRLRAAARIEAGEPAQGDLLRQPTRGRPRG